MIAYIVLILLQLNGKNVDNKYNQFMLKYVNSGQFSGAVLLAKDGKVIFEKAYGFENIEKKIPNSLESQFKIGSMTKTITATASLRLVNLKVLRLDQKIKRVIPNISENIADATLLNLLQMTTGLPSRIEDVLETSNIDVTEKQLLLELNKSLSALKLNKGHSYSNLSYNLAALYLSFAMNLTFPEVLDSLIFKPLNMKSTGAERLSLQPKHKALGYEIGSRSKNKDGSPSLGDLQYMAYTIGSGDVFSTVRDLLKWDQALYRDDFLNDSLRHLMLRGEKAEDGYGIGFKIRKYTRANLKEEGKLARHGGSMRGYYSNLHRYIDDKLTVIVLGNIRPFPIMDISVGLKELYFGRELKERNGRY